MNATASPPEANGKRVWQLRIVTARRNDIRKYIWLICIVAFTLSVGVRLLEFPRWDLPELQANGERLLATNDAYYWVAGAEGVNTDAEPLPMATLLDTVSGILPVPLADIAFWASILLAALVAVPVALWCDLLGFPKPAVAVALLVTLTPAFYNRTRFGFYDSDWATLFFPLLIAWFLGIWLQARLRKSGQSTHNKLPNFSDHQLAVILILLTAIAVPWHNSIGIYVYSILAIALLLILLWGNSADRTTSFSVLAAVALVVWAGWIGAAVGLGLVWLADHFPTRWLRHRSFRRIEIILIAILIMIAGFYSREYLVNTIAVYMGKIFGQAGSQTSSFRLIFPDLIQSIRETQRINLGKILSGMAFHSLLGVAGIIGYLILLRKIAAAWLLLPLLLLGLGAVRLGIRFTMYGAPVILLGLSAAFEWLIDRIPKKPWGTSVKIGLVAIILLAVIPSIYQLVWHNPVGTVVDQAHAEALSNLGEIGDPAGTIWTWWDYGYASQHFSGMNTFADGSHNYGEYLFSLGTVFGSESLDRSAELIRFTAENQYTPWGIWVTWSEDEWKSWLDELGKAVSSSESLPAPAYLVVQWDAIRFLPWIQFYGNWDFAAQQSQPSQVWNIVLPQQLDLNIGIFHYDNGQIAYPISVDIIGDAGVEHHDYPASIGGPHLLVNETSTEVIFLDDSAYHSAFIQLLLLPADQLDKASPFHLLIDNQPFVRIFELR